MTDLHNSKRFAIAVSFPGEHRRFVLNVVKRLEEVMGRDRVFYDKWYESDLAGRNSKRRLVEIYRDQSQMVVPFFSEHYQKPWCGVEWHAIEAMLFERQDDNAVLPIEIDGTRIPGWEKIDYTIRKGRRSGKEIADIILGIYLDRYPDKPADKATKKPVTDQKNAYSSMVPRWSDELSTYGDGFAGRKKELQMLEEAWNGGLMRVLVFHAEGGAGKTRLLVQWLNSLRDRGWPDVGGVFVHSFYSQGNREHGHASSELFFLEALEYFGYEGETITDARSSGQTLARLVAEKQGLLILDGLEPLQHPMSFNEGRLQDPGIEQLLLTLATLTSGGSRFGLCVVSSRQPVFELKVHRGQIVKQQALERLDKEAGASLLRQLDVQGTDYELFEAVDEYRGHAYSLMLVGTYLRDATDDHDIRKRSEIPLLEEDKEHRSHADQLFSAYVLHLGEGSPEVALLRLLGLFDRAAERKLIDVLCEAQEDQLDTLTLPLRNLSVAEWTRTLSRLRELRLIVIGHGRGIIDSHPLLREYFGEKLRRQFQATYSAAHSRLFDCLCEATEYQPDTLEGLQPLYQAVTHGCLAGRHEEALNKVYIDRILRGTTGDRGYYSLKKLGASGANLGAVAVFFDVPWERPSPNLSERFQAWLLSEAAFNLRALGRLKEALEPMRTGLEMSIDEGDWENVAIGYNNLSELQLNLGQLNQAVTDGSRCMDFSVQSQNELWEMASKTTMADALHQYGEYEEASMLFEKARSQTKYVLLYSIWGFRYNDLILAPVELTMWRCMLFDSINRSKSELLSKVGSIVINHVDVESALSAIAVTSRRANQLFEWKIADDSLLDIALIHLTLARVGIYQAILSRYGRGIKTKKLPILQKPSNENVRQEIDLALNSLRRANIPDHLARALLTAALFHAQQGKPGTARAKECLNEAQQIAERGPMPLYLADIHLHRARLFHDREELQKARILIDKHHYGRRFQELGDAETAAAYW